MTKYYNTKTGAIIDSPFLITGENWINYEDKVEVDDSEEDVTEEDSKENIEDDVSSDKGLYNKFTKAQIENELEALGVEYDSKASKDELYKLLMEQ